jgi:hypothetical protein
MVGSPQAILRRFASIIKSSAPRQGIGSFVLTGMLSGFPWSIRQSGRLTSDARSLFEGLPALVPVWRGCGQGRARGMSWTTDRKVAKRFAIGQRHMNTTPTLVSAKIPRQHIFGVFVDRNEKEIVLNPDGSGRCSASLSKCHLKLQDKTNDASHSRFRLQQFVN